MMNTAGSPTCPMEILAAVTSHISWAPPLPSPALQVLSWNKVRGRLSVSTPAIPTGMTANLCAEVSFRIVLHLFWISESSSMSAIMQTVYEIWFSIFFQFYFSNWNYKLSYSLSFLLLFLNFITKCSTNPYFQTHGVLCLTSCTKWESNLIH